MKMSIQSLFFVFVTLTVLLSGCAPASAPSPIPPTGTPNLTSTATSIPSPTLLPMLPTFTQEPSSTNTTSTNLITSIKVLLPEQYKWEQITNNSDGDQYIREWVPQGSTGSNTKWIIVEQKFVIKSPVSANEFLITIFTLSKDDCTDILYNGPENIDVEGHETSVGRFMCAEQNGTDYGTFTDQRVVAQGNDIYIVTSEIRIPISPKAGVLSFQKDQQDELQAFLTMQELSAIFVRKFVEICTSDTIDC